MRSFSLVRRCSFLLTLLAAQAFALDPASAWKRADSILARISPPAFPATVVDVTAYGARPDGSSDCTRAFARAIDDCARQGGGTVLVPDGQFLTGPIHLKSNINLHLADGATIRFQPDPARCLPVVFTRWEGVECMNYSPLIYAFGQTNVAVTGNGTLDGQANDSTWWDWKGKGDAGPQQAARKKLFAMGQSGVPVSRRVFGDGSYLRPNFIEFYRCTNVLVQGVRIVNSPMWEIHPVLCANVSVVGVRISSHGPNNDGCNPESSRDVLIKDCTFDTGDDCIAIKSGRNNDGRRLMTPSENIIITGCLFRDGHGAVTLGSEISGGVRNVFASRCTARSPILYSALRLKNNAERGGVLEDIYVRDFEVHLVGRAAVDVDLLYEEGKNGAFTPVIRRIGVERMSVDTCSVAFNLVGYANAPLHDILLKDCDFRKVTAGYTVSNVCGLETIGCRINGNPLVLTGAGDSAGRQHPWSVRIADSFIASHPGAVTYDSLFPQRTWNYEQGLMLVALERLGRQTGENRYLDFVRENIDHYVRDDGTIETYRLADYNLDNIAPGRVLLALYLQSGQEKYLRAADTLRRQLREQPRTREGGFWHKQIYPWQMWLDGLFMAEPFYATWGVLFHDLPALDDVLAQFRAVTRHTRDNETGLLYHGWDESRTQRWADTATGHSRIFWARAIGWYTMALVEVLDILPADFEGREELAGMLRDAARAVAAVQDSTGLWYQVIDQPGRAGNYLEASASAMFAYSFARSVKAGYLDSATYAPRARAAFRGITRRLVRIEPGDHIVLEHTCKGAGLGGNPYRDGSYEYYVSEPRRDNDLKGLGSFLLAAIAIEQLDGN